MANSRLEEIRTDRLVKLERLKVLGIDPYPAKYSKNLISIAEALNLHGKEMSVAGRLWNWREHGGGIFSDLRHSPGQI